MTRGLKSYLYLDFIRITLPEKKNREGKTLCRVRFIKAGAFAMAVRIAVAEVVAVDLDGPAAVFTVALPPSLVTCKPGIFDWSDNLQIPEGLSC